MLIVRAPGVRPFRLAAAVVAVLCVAACTSSHRRDRAAPSPPARSAPATSPGATGPSPAPPSPGPAGSEQPGAGEPGTDGAGPGGPAGGGTGRDTGAPGTGPAPGARPGGAAPPGGTPGPGPGGASPVVAWILDFLPGGASGGSSDPGFGEPAAAQAYKALAVADCATALDLARWLSGAARRLYRGAARACLAATGDQAGDTAARWAAAARDRASVDPATLLDCYVRDVYRLLSDLLEAHRRHPALAIGRRHDGAAASTCPRLLRVEPDRGPPGGGQRVRLTGANLPDEVYVVFGPFVFGPVPTRGGRAEIVTPPWTGGARVVGVTVEGWPLSPLAYYTYDGAESSGGGRRMPA